MLRGLLLLSLALLGSACSKLFFIPESELIRVPTDIGIKYQEEFVTTADGTMLHGWLLKSEKPAAGTVIFLHGNAQNISYHIASVGWLVKEGFDVFLYDYRGFGKSEGESNFNNAISDFSDVLSHLRSGLPESEQQFIVFGQSLGAALTIAGVHAHHSEKSIKAVILDSAFSGFRTIAREKLGLLFSWPAVADLFALTVPEKPVLTELIPELSPLPILFIHGGKDSIVPVTHTILLYEKAREPKQLWIEPDATHIASIRTPDLRRRFVSFLNQSFAAVGN